MKTPSLFEGLDQGSSVSEVQRNLWFAVLQNYIINPSRTLVLNTPHTADQYIDGYAMAPFLMLNPDLCAGLLGRESAREFHRLVALAVTNYNALAQPEGSAREALKRRIASIYPSWPK